MKKCYFNYLAVVTCIFMSCSDAKEEVVPTDTTPPVITMLGKNPDSLIVKTVSSYSDPGATAADDKDGDITSKIVVSPQPYDFNNVGSFIIYYNVEDNAHNLAPKLTRTVVVVKADATYDASYSCPGNTSNSITITSFSNNDSIKIKNIFFAGDSIYAGLNNHKYVIVPMTFSGTTINGDLTANGVTLNGNITFTGPFPGSCTGTFTRH